MRLFSSGEFWYAAYWVKVLLVQLCITVGFGVASLGVKMLPKDHPLHQYHSFSKEKVRPAYIKAARRLR